MALPFLGGLTDLSSLETLYCHLTYCCWQPWAAQLSWLVCMTAQQKIALKHWRRLLHFPDTYIGFTQQYSISMVCLILVQCYPSFDWHFKPLAQSQTPVNHQDLGAHSTDVNNGDLTPVSSPLHVLATVFNPFAGPVIFSSPLHTPPAPPSCHHHDFRLEKLSWSCAGPNVVTWFVSEMWSWVDTGPKVVMWSHDLVHPMWKYMGIWLRRYVFECLQMS